MYISHPFYSCFNSLSGPFRNYACRSCLLKLVLINCILWKVLSAHWKCIIRFLPFWLLWKSIRYMFIRHEEGTDFCKQNICFSCTKTSILMKKWQQWVFINVMYYSTAFLNFIFKETCLTFCLLCCTYFCLNGPAEQTKLLYFLHIHTLTCCSKNSFFHLSHFDSLSLQIIIKKKHFLNAWLCCLSHPNLLL